MNASAIGQNPKKQKRITHSDPLQSAIASAEKDFWTMRPPKDIRKLVARAIREQGRDKTFWVFECIRAGLARGKTDVGPVVLRKGAA